MSKNNPPHRQDHTGGPNREIKSPLYGFVPRMVTAKQVQRALVGGQLFGCIFGPYLRYSPKHYPFMITGWGCEPLQQATALGKV